MRRLSLALLVLHAGLAGGPDGMSAARANPLTDLLMDEDPCDGLPGIDHTDFVRVNSAAMDLDGDILSLRATGKVRCVTSGNAFIRADASARIALAARLDFTDCRIWDIRVALDDFGGAAGPVLELGRGAIEALLRRELAGSLAEACAALTK